MPFARIACVRLGPPLSAFCQVAVSASDSIADIVAALLEADQLGLRGEAAYGNAVARKARLEEEAALVAELEAAMAASDLQALSRHVATCMRLGIANKHPGVMAKAKAKAAELGAQQQVDFVRGLGRPPRLF
jgi:hypothetical protein